MALWPAGDPAGSMYRALAILLEPADTRIKHRHDALGVGLAGITAGLRRRRRRVRPNGSLVVVNVVLEVALVRGDSDGEGIWGALLRQGHAGSKAKWGSVGQPGETFNTRRPAGGGAARPHDAWKSDHGGERKRKSGANQEIYYRGVKGRKGGMLAMGCGL